MIKFFRRIRQQLISENKPDLQPGRFNKYFLYAIGEIFLVVIGILIALQINNWNLSKLQIKKEIEILKSFENQFKNDVIEFERSLAFYRGAKKSIGIILDHLEKDLPYSDSLKLHFFISTRTYGTSDLDNNVFETLKSVGVDLLSNKELMKGIVQLYDDNDEWIESFEKDYIDFLLDASQNIFNTRFNEFWNGDYRDLNFQGEMIPLDFESLKSDQEYLYFIRTQKNLIGWLIEKPIETTKSKTLSLKKDLKKEIERLGS